jgi:hypothetical protein
MSTENPSSDTTGHSALDELGRLLMERVRDPSIAQCDKLVQGELKTALSKKINDSLTGQSVDHAVVHDLIPVIVDTTIAYLLNMIDQEDAIDIVIRLQSSKPLFLKPLEDGLEGWLYGDDGWIKKLSSQRSS